jgi:hypothetical protein
MDIIVDGYNLIGSEFGLTGALEYRRSWLLQNLRTYQKLKGFNIIVVFDGWKSGAAREVEEKMDGLTVIYSRQGEKADFVIIRVARQKGSGCVVVSSDREIRSAVEKFGAAAIYAGEFSAILRRIHQAGTGGGSSEVEFQPARKGNPLRLSKSERVRQEKLKKLSI